VRCNLDEKGKEKSTPTVLNMYNVNEISMEVLEAVLKTEMKKNDEEVHRNEEIVQEKVNN